MRSTNDVTAASQDGSMGMKSNLPNTFKGDRGGDAADAELLAELRAISMKTSSNRFDGEDDEVGAAISSNDSNVIAAKSDSTMAEKPWKTTSRGKQRSDPSSKPLPPWKQKNATSSAARNADMDVVVGLPSASSATDPSIELSRNLVEAAAVPQDEKMGIKSNLPNTFKGERGGDAADADLLAELRAISMKNSRQRFSEEEEEADVIPTHDKSAEDPEPQRNKSSVASRNLGESKPQANHNNPANQLKLPKAPPQESALPAQGSASVGFGGMSPNPPPSADAEIIINLEGLDETLKSPKWQLRKASYLFLHDRLTSFLSGNDPTNHLDGGEVYASMDKTIPLALKDKNAGALDAALTLAILYADSCQGACCNDAASLIMTSLLKGSAFSSSRSSTLSSTEELVLKLIEVSPESSSSIIDILDLIQEHGLKSRKPKMILFSAKLILKSVHTFGASVLPIPKLSSHSESLIAHSNAQAREIGIQLLAEICRTLGSKTPLQSLVDKLKSSQQSQLDKLLESQPVAIRPSKRLRCKMGEPVVTQSPEEALAALKKSQEEADVKRLAARPAVNLFQVLPKTCYKEKIKLDKWSEKVAAVNALIEAGGEEPFKLCPPSSSVNYTPLIREMRTLLSHTHFAVCSKALAALGMLSEGVGEQLFSNLRPLIPTLAVLFKDKKVSNAVGSCLDKMFANVFSFEHLLDSSDSLQSSLDEKKQKNALVRSKILDYLSRCVKSSGTYGSRGDLTSQYAEGLSKLACEKLKDSDAATRKAATNVLLALLSCKDEPVVLATKKVTASLESSNPRAYKSLNLVSGGDKKAADRPQSAPTKASIKTSKRGPSSNQTTNGKNSSAKNAGLPKPPPSSNGTDEGAEEKSLPSFEDSVQILSGLAVAKWGDDIDDGGILAGIQSSNWKARMGALNQLAEFYKNAEKERVGDTIPSLFVLVRDCTKSFKESNFNVAKALLALFTAIFDIHKQLVRAPETYLYNPVTKFAVEKVGDRKLSGASSLCLDTLCTVKDPPRVLAVAVKTIGGVKSPLVHEALLGWFKIFCVDFGVASLSKGIQDCLAWVLKECESNNMKVRKSALDVIGVMHSQLGPVLQAFVKSKDIQISSIDKAFSDNPHDTNAQNMDRKMKCITLSVSGDSSHQGSQSKTSSLLSIPTTDLMASLKSDCLSRINASEGKSAWKQRKEGMEEVKIALGKCGGLIATEGKSFISLKQLFLALRSRLNDSQSNLKPIAAALIGLTMSHVDDEAQAKLGKIVFPALANAAMTDMKKTMRDAATSALLMGTERPTQNGGGTNLSSTESFIICLESGLSDAALKSSGLSDVLTFFTGRVESLFSAEQKEKSKPILPKKELAKVIVQSLLSSKSGTRSSAEKLLKVCTEHGILPPDALDKEIGRLLPAQQRTIRSVIPKLSTQEQQPVETFKRPPSRAQQSSRPNSARRSTRPEMTKSNKAPGAASSTPASVTSTEPNTVGHRNPLHPNTSKSMKLQRLSLLGRSDHWPDYPEEPSDDATLQTLHKSWSSLISSSSMQLLFPKGGIRSHLDAVKGCEIISQSIEYSLDSNDASFLEQLDFIFKWTACALSSRDHTSGLRSLLSMVQLLFKHLHELSYVMNDAEATILLPCILEKAASAKSQFKDQFADILSFVRSNDLYPLQRYGSNICMRVVEKSKSSRARSLAACECSSCVSVIGIGALGKKGLVVLAQALSIEKVTEIRKSYLDLFCNAAEKYGNLDKLLSFIGNKLSDKARQMIVDRCCKRPSTAPATSQSAHSDEPKQSRLRTPSRKSVVQTSNLPHSASKESHQPPSSSSMATETLRLRLQSHRSESHAPPGSLPSSPARARQLLPPSPRSAVGSNDLYMTTLNDIKGMVNAAETTLASDSWVVKGSRAIHILSLAIKNDASEGSLNVSQIQMLRDATRNDIDQCVETLASVLAFAFRHGHKNATLPYPLINSTTTTLRYVFSTPDYAVALSQNSLEYTIRVTVETLLDHRLAAVDGKTRDNPNTVMRSINKLAMREAMAPSLETSLLALISLQQSALSSGENQPATVSRVYTKLYKKVMKDEHEKNPTDPLHIVRIEFVLLPLEQLLQTMEDVRLGKADSQKLLTDVREMAKDLMFELVKCKGGSLRQQFEFPEGSLVEKLLSECEQELGLPNHSARYSESKSGSAGGQKGSPVESKDAQLAELVHNLSKPADGPTKQVALVALCDFTKSNADIDLAAHLSHISPQFKQYILDQVGKASKENIADDSTRRDDSMNERMKKLQLKVGREKESKEEPPLPGKADSIIARLETYRH